MKGLVFVLLAILTPALATFEQEPPCRQPLASLVVPQRGYVQVNVPAFEQRVYLYAPDIKSGWDGGFSAFQLWIVEGVYGKPFIQSSGSLDQRAFDQLRQSQNIKATPINVVKRSAGAKRDTFAIGKQRFVLELVKVNTSLGGTDTVTVNICR